MKKMTYNDTVEIPSLREEQVRLTQQRILDTFESELLERGYSDISIRSVAKRAGISVPTVYRHYPNKEALLLALMEATQNEQGFNFYEVLTDVSDPMATVTKLLDGTWDINEQRPGRTKAILHAIAAPGEAGTGKVVSEIVNRFAFMSHESLVTMRYLPADELEKLEAMVALLLSRPAWERLRFGHNLSRDLARSAVLDTLSGLLDLVQSRFPAPKGYKPPEPVVRDEAVIKERFKRQAAEA
jgi:AcrR family transcriptional regulator